MDLPFRYSPGSPAGGPSLKRAFLSLLISSVFLTCCARFSQAALSVDPDAPHAAVWRRLYARMPTLWKSTERLKLREVSEEEMRHIAADVDGDANTNGDSVVDGMYQEAGDTLDSPPIITLCPQLEGTEPDMLFAHEYGHFVWNTKFTDAQHARFRRIWREQKRAGRLITEYAGEDLDEGFAEAFAFYLCRPDDLSATDQRAWAFLHDICSSAGALRGSGDAHHGGAPAGKL